MNGILNLNKPPGKSSFALVSLVRRLTEARRVGHGGTLDPGAEGVLPILVGQATRMSSFLLQVHKVYRAWVRLGVVTDTYDAEGSVVAQGDPSRVTREQVLEALQQFRGVIQQLPPMYSALKRQGRPLYRLARAGIQVERTPREAQVYRLELVRWEPPLLELEVECGRGTYIRSLAHDLGTTLGCGAHLHGLLRTRVGPFGIEEALSVEALFDAVHGGYWEQHLYPLDHLLLELPALILDEEDERAVSQGRSLPSPDTPTGVRALASGALCRAYSQDGRFVALLSSHGTHPEWRPSRVFLAEDGPRPADAI